MRRGDNTRTRRPGSPSWTWGPWHVLRETGPDGSLRAFCGVVIPFFRAGFAALGFEPTSRRCRHCLLRWVEALSNRPPPRPDPGQPAQSR